MLIRRIYFLVLAAPLITIFLLLLTGCSQTELWKREKIFSLLRNPDKTENSVILVQEIGLLEAPPRIIKVWTGNTIEEAGCYLAASGRKWVAWRDYRSEGYKLPEYAEIEAAKRLFATKGVKLICLPSLTDA